MRGNFLNDCISNNILAIFSVSVVVLSTIEGNVTRIAEELDFENVFVADVVEIFGVEENIPFCYVRDVFNWQVSIVDISNADRFGIRKVFDNQFRTRFIQSSERLGSESAVEFGYASDQEIGKYLLKNKA